MNLPEIRPLVGIEEALLDNKGRLLISVKKRERIGENFAFFLGKCSCVILVPEGSWRQLIDDLMQVDLESEARQQFCRLALGAAQDEMNFDAHGRVLIPKDLRDAAKLREKVIVLGCLDHLEIWSAEEFQYYQTDPDAYLSERRATVSRAYNLIMSELGKTKSGPRDLPGL